MTFPGYTHYVNEAAESLGIQCLESRGAAGKASILRDVADMVVQALAHGKGADVSDTVRRVRELVRAAKIALEAIERMAALIDPPTPDQPPAPAVREGKAVAKP